MCSEVRHDNVRRFPGTRKVCLVSQNGDGIEASTEQHGIDDSQHTEMRTGMVQAANWAWCFTSYSHNFSPRVIDSIT